MNERCECLVMEADTDSGGTWWYCITHRTMWRTAAFEDRPVRCAMGEYAAEEKSDDDTV